MDEQEEMLEMGKWLFLSFFRLAVNLHIESQYCLRLTTFSAVVTKVGPEKLRGFHPADGRRKAFVDSGLRPVIHLGVRVPEGAARSSNASVSSSKLLTANISSSHEKLGRMVLDYVIQQQGFV